MLEKHFSVTTHLGGGILAIPRIFLRVARADVCISWFASVYAFVMVLAGQLLGKKTIIQLGGVDTAANAELHYGIWLSRWKSVLVRYALRHADRVFAIHPNLKAELQKNSGWSAETLEWVPTGYDPDFWQPQYPRQAKVLCIAKCDTRLRIRVKGIDRLVEVARCLPDVSFEVVGIAPSRVSALLGDVPTNITFIPPSSREELLSFYQNAKVYCQLSRHEGGFPNTLCEAMLCGCIPVGTPVGGIPFAIDRFGFLVNGDDVKGICESIRKALALPDQWGLEGRAHIAQNFPLRRRERTLIETIHQLTHKEP